MNTTFKELIDELTRESRKPQSNLILTMENVFSFREIGNKTHGDFAEIGLSQFINSHMPGWKSDHVGKALFRSKESEEDIEVTSPTGVKIPVSIKAYGNGPLQLSTNKDSTMFSFLKNLIGESTVSDQTVIKNILSSQDFQDISSMNILPLIYSEKKKRCRIMVFNWTLASAAVAQIQYVSPGKKRRKHPIYLFSDKDGNYLFEVRYGDEQANALQRGLWTHTERALPHFILVTDWISYKTNQTLLELVSNLLVLVRDKHKELLDLIKRG